MCSQSGITSIDDSRILCVKGACKEYGDVTVLDSVEFALSRGEAAAIVGRNGAGKSTLLKCLVGAEGLDGGAIHVCGSELDEGASKHRSVVASLLDDIVFFPDISAIEHLRLLAWLHGSEHPEATVEAVVTELGIDGFRDQLPPTLSSGQRHRLGLASCFVRPRLLLVLDEPEQRLDANGRAWLQERLLLEKAGGCAVVFASHDDTLVDAVADLVVEINR